jgi:hypothetical protein
MLTTLKNFLKFLPALKSSRWKQINTSNRENTAVNKQIINLHKKREDRAGI